MAFRTNPIRTRMPAFKPARPMVAKPQPQRINPAAKPLAAAYRQQPVGPRKAPRGAMPKQPMSRRPGAGTRVR